MKDMIAGETLIAWGYAPGPWFATAIAADEVARRGGGELQRDWARDTSTQAFAEILAAHGGGSGVAYAWEVQPLTTGARA
jgi:hypothetical protein